MMANQHPSEDTIESYALGRLAYEEVRAVEEHLLICEVCQNAMQIVDDLRLALAALEQEQVTKGRATRAGV